MSEIEVITPDRQMEKFDASDIRVSCWGAMIDHGKPIPAHIDIGLENPELEQVFEDGHPHRFAPHRYSIIIEKATFHRIMAEAKKLGWLDRHA